MQTNILNPANNKVENNAASSITSQSSSSSSNPNNTDWMRKHLLAHNDDRHPALYVGTYRKYNNGSLAGAWLDLTTFDSYEEFMDCCYALHCDEEEPELMMQDYENFPREFYSEGCFCERYFDLIIEFWLLSSTEQDAFYAYLGCFGLDYCYGDDIIGDFRRQYEGEFSSEADFAQYLVEELGMLNDVPDNVKSYFDYDAFARDLFLSDYYYDNGYVFRR